MKKQWIVFSLAAGLIILSGRLAASPAAVDDDIARITREVYPSVVRVEARDGWRKVATGVVIDKQGHIVTTALITPHDDEVFVTTTDGKRHKAEFLGMDSVTNLAVVKAEEGKWHPIEWGEDKGLEAGSWIGVVSISPEETPVVTQGIVSSMGRENLQLNVWVVPGASGSPVIDRKGRMIGLVRGSYVDGLRLSIATRMVTEGGVVFNREEAPSSALAMAIPVEIVVKVSSEIKEKGKVERGWLGVTIGEDSKGDVVIADVDRDSPAGEAGVEKDDIILKFDGVEVTGSNMLAREIRLRRPGDKVDVVIKRDDSEKTLRVELGERSEEIILGEFRSKFPRLFTVPERDEPKAGLPRQFEVFSGGRQYIGVYLQELNEELAEYFGAGETGLLINRISESGPAEKAGLKVGDVIVKADGKAIRDQSDLTRLIQRKDEGEFIELEIIRDRKKQAVKVEIASDEGTRRFISERFGPIGEVWDLSREAWHRAEEQTKKSREGLKNRIEVFNENLKENTLRLRDNLLERLEKGRSGTLNLNQWYRCIKV
jgi:S1-C subfamily serine protease